MGAGWQCHQLCQYLLFMQLRRTSFVSFLACSLLVLSFSLLALLIGGQAFSLAQANWQGPQQAPPYCSPDLGSPATPGNVDTWTVHSATEEGFWQSITFGTPVVSGGGLFASINPGTHRVITSPNGVDNWTPVSAGPGIEWNSVTYGDNKFVAVGKVLSSDTGRVMTSTDGGIVWTVSNPLVESLYAVTYGNNRFVAVGKVSGPGNNFRGLTSSDGLTWTLSGGGFLSNSELWHSVTWSPELHLFVAVKLTPADDNAVMTSLDGDIWTLHDVGQALNLSSVAWSPELGIFATPGVNSSGDNIIMTSQPPTPAVAPLNPCYAPINTSAVDQAKTGKLIVWNDLLGDRIFATNKLGVGADSVNHPDTSVAKLDVAGQVRLRYSCPNCNGKVLTSDAEGRGSWAGSSVPISPSSLIAGLGILLTTPDPLKPSEIKISVSTTTIQQRNNDPTNVCGNSSAITTISATGTVACLPLVSNINNTNSGLMGGGNGAVSLVVNTTGGGLTTSGGSLAIKPPVAGSGLIVSNIGTTAYLQFATSTNLWPICSGGNVYWKYDTATGWNCGGTLTSSQSGGSVLYLTRRSIDPLPFACPNDWTDPGTLHTESTGTTANKVRKCWRNDLSCQVLYLKSLATPPSCPSGWAMSTSNPANWSSGPSEYYTEYTIDNTSNYVRACFKCNL